MSYLHIVLYIIPNLIEGCIVSVPILVMENRPVDPGSIQGSHRPISFMINIEHARTIFCVKLSINNHIVGLVHKIRIIRTCLMYHAACKVEFQPFKQVVLTADVFQLPQKVHIVYFKLKNVSCEYNRLNGKRQL